MPCKEFYKDEVCPGRRDVVLRELAGVGERVALRGALERPPRGREALHHEDYSGVLGGEAGGDGQTLAGHM